MAEETTEVAQTESGTPEAPAGVDAPNEAMVTDELAAVEAEPVNDSASPKVETAEQPAASAAPKTATEPDTPKEPDALQPYIDKAFETIQHEIEHAELDAVLRGHVKTFREEWDIWPDSAKDAYLHMMASQLVQRKAAKTRIMNYEEFKLPVPSAHAKLFESIRQSQVKPKKCMPVLLLPPNLRPTYSLKK
jgi:hypothetical protein